MTLLILTQSFLQYGRVVDAGQISVIFFKDNIIY